MVLRTAGIVVNIIFLIFLGRLTEIYHFTYPAAYVAACWAVCTDTLEIGILLNKSRSFPRLSGGGQLALDLIGVFLLVPAALLNWYFSAPPHGDFQPSVAEKERNEWATDAPWSIGGGRASAIGSRKSLLGFPTLRDAAHGISLPS
ncbi:hypothetical protein BDV59DRAFT_73270 [Aspergillus ambiguus]|uniref:uncharacterized protein n=1 Tax=Aspergillus ambiguus TaxID=176160 RepID=UPI003CCCCF14